MEGKLMRKNKENKEKKEKKKKCRLWLLILSLIVIISNLFAIYNILLLGPIEEVIRYIIIGIFVILDIIIIFKVRSKRRNNNILFNTLSNYKLCNKWFNNVCLWNYL